MGWGWRWHSCVTSCGFRMDLLVRAMQSCDVPAACVILNEIIAVGGTTAHQRPFDETGFARAHLGADHIVCHVVLDPQDVVAGFQWLGRNADLPRDCADIATFTRREPPLKGAGRALMAATHIAARAAGFAQINATIRADNVPGLGYYSAMGFRDHGLSPAVALDDGSRVDRIHKRLQLLSSVSCG